MHWPVVKPELVEFMRTKQKALTGGLGALEADAHKREVPVIPHETVVFFFKVFIRQLQLKLLEIGTAIGFSASLMTAYLAPRDTTTIGRYDVDD